MANYSYADEAAFRRKKTFEAEASLLDLIELLAESMTDPVAHFADKVYCYCNIKGSEAIFRSFYTEGEKAYELTETMDVSAYARLEDRVVEQLDLTRKLYSYCTEMMPSELFFEFAPLSGEVHALKTDNDFCSDYDARIRFKAWFEEHGGKGKPIGPRFHGFEEKIMWKLFKAGEEKAENPTADAVEIDVKALEASRQKVEKLESPSASHTSVAYAGYLEGETGFLAIKDAFDEFYPNDESPDYLYDEDVWELRDDYKFFSKDYDYTLYEYIAIYEDAECWHAVSLGMSDIGDKIDTLDKRYGVEYTMRIKKCDDKKLDEAERANAINLVALLADEAYNKGRMFEGYSYVSLGHRKGMDYKRNSDKTAFIIVPDARIGSIDGPFGKVHLRQAVPITSAEYKALKAKQIDVPTLYEKIGTDLADYSRPSVI